MAHQIADNLGTSGSPTIIDHDFGNMIQGTLLIKERTAGTIEVGASPDGSVSIDDVDSFSGDAWTVYSPFPDHLELNVTSGEFDVWIIPGYFVNDV